MCACVWLMMSRCLHAGYLAGIRLFVEQSGFRGTDELLFFGVSPPSHRVLPLLLYLIGLRS